MFKDLAAGGEDELVGGDDAAVALDPHVAEHAVLARDEALQLTVERRQVQVERRRRGRHPPPRLSRQKAAKIPILFFAERYVRRMCSDESRDTRVRTPDGSRLRACLRLLAFLLAGQAAIVSLC